MGKLGWLGVLVLCASLGLHNGSRIAPVPLIEELRLRYQADYASVGAAIGAYTLSYAFAQLVAGILADRLGSRRLIQAGLLVMTLGSGVFALAPSYALAVVGRLVMGVAGGLLYVPALSYMLAAFGRAERGKAMGLAQGGIGAAIVLSILLMPPLFLLVGLTGAYLTYPILAVLLWVSLTMVIPEIPPEGQRAGGSVMALARDRDFWLLFVGFAFVGMLAQTSVVSWIPTYLRQEFGLGVAEAGAAGALVAAGLIADLRPARRSAGLAPAGNAGRQRDRVGGLPAAARAAGGSPGPIGASASLWPHFGPGQCSLQPPALDSGYHDEGTSSWRGDQQNADSLERRPRRARTRG